MNVSFSQPARPLANFMLVCSAALIALVVVYALVPLPFTLTTTAAGADIRYHVDDARILTRGACIEARWQIAGIRAVWFNDRPTTGEQTRTVCSEPLRLRVALEDGSEREYRFVRDVVLDRTDVRLMLVLALACLAAGVHLRTHPVTTLVPARVRRWLAAAERRDGRAHVIALVSVMALGAGLRLLVLDQPLRADEAASFNQFAAVPLALGISDYAAVNNHPLNTLFMHLAYVALGESAFTIRLFAFVTGLLIVPLVYSVGRALYDAHAALLAATLTAVVSPLILYSTNGRGYSALIVFFLLLVWLGLRQQRRATVRRWVLYASAAALAVYTVPSGLYAVAAAGGWLGLTLLVGRRWRDLLAFAVTMTGAGLLTVGMYLPFVFGSGVASLTSNEVVTRVTDPRLLGGQILVLIDEMATRWTMGLPLVVTALVAGGVLLGLWRDVRLARRVPLLAAVAAVFAAAVVVQGVVGFARTWLFLVPLIALTAAGGWSLALPRLIRGRTFALGVVVVAAALTVYSVQSDAIMQSGETAAFPDLPALIDTLSANVQPGDAVLFRARYRRILHYYFLQRELPLDVLANEQPTGQVYMLINTREETLSERLERFDAALAGYGEPQRIAQYPYGGELYRLLPNNAR